jgi:hypothetical protein
LQLGRRKNASEFFREDRGFPAACFGAQQSQSAGKTL